MQKNKEFGFFDTASLTNRNNCSAHRQWPPKNRRLKRLRSKTETKNRVESFNVFHRF